MFEYKNYNYDIKIHIETMELRSPLFEYSDD